MTAHFMASKAYRTDVSATRTPRRIELDIFARITSGLAAAASTDFPALAAAVDKNRRFWTHLATEVAGKDNGLPEDLRARLFYLAEFTSQHSSKVLAGSATVDPLVDINTAVMRGLKGDK